MKLLLHLLLLLSIKNACAQARIVINNGGIINIEDSAYLVVDNPNPNAITRNTSGHIISETENDRVRWNIGTTAGSYIVPFGLGTSSYLPVSFTTSGAVGSGHFIFSTYSTPTWQNSLYMPATVTHMNSDIDGSDNSNHVLDRFYQLNATGYATRPTITNMQLSYLDIEHTVASNAIIESFLQAQRWNPNLSDWNDLNPIGTVNTGTNQVDILMVSPPNFYPWWVLVDNQFPLPIELVSFTAACIDNKAELKWQTASEWNNDYFVIERATDGNNFQAIATIESNTGNSTTLQQYAYTDTQPLANSSYYRLKQVDYSGHSTYSSILHYSCTTHPRDNSIKLFPNPSNQYVQLDIQNLIGSKEAIWYNTKGQIVLQRKLLGESASSSTQFDISILAQGTYLLQINVDNEIYQVIKVVKN